MKIVVLGGGGRLGAALVREWSAAGDSVLGFNRAQLDLGDLEKLRATLQAIRFDALVNSAALTNVDYCESHENEARRVNADAVRVIGEVCAQKRARCLHISTDYVFDGAKTTPYVEEDVARPLGVYGASKLVGEQALSETSDQHLAVRVSWVFGPDRPSFVDQILNRAMETEKLAAIADKVAVPTYTLDLVHWLRPFLSEIAAGGRLHLCHHGACTWQEYGQFAIECAVANGVPLKGRTVAPLKMAELKAFVARRPPYTVMSTNRFAKLSGIAPRSWEEAVDEYVRDYWRSAPKGISAP